MSEKRTITWIYSPARSGDFGFVDVEGEQKGYYVHWFNKKDALPGDKVLANVKSFRWKDEAVIIKVVERSDKIFIWNFQPWKKNKKWNWFAFWFVVIRDQNFKTDVFVPGKYIGKAKDWDLVWVKIISWENKKSPKWEIVEVLWDESKLNLSVDSYILESGFKQKFSHKVEEQLKKISDKIDIKKTLWNDRKDLRKLFTFTIDGEDAKDLDDAISIEKRQNWNIELYVHIADVANYIIEDSILDKEAISRATSVYLADRVIPMLPKKLSNNLCSLNPDTPKLTLTCEMLIWKDWIIRKTKVYESLIESNFRLTYKEVDEIVWNPHPTSPLGGEEQGQKTPSPSKERVGVRVLKVWDTLFWGQKLNGELIEKIQISEELKESLQKNRDLQWNLDFDFPETKVILDEQKNVLEIKRYPRYASNKMIELFMVSANESVSRLFSDLPFLHRIHPKPNEEDILKLQNTLNLFWVDFVLKKFDTKEFSELLEKIENHKAKWVLEKVVLRTLSKAVYSPDNEGHFGLGLDYYSHFTSPIRRYPDLQIHRIIKEKLHKKLDKQRINHYETILEQIALRCSTQERKAEKLEYKVRDYYTCKFYESKVWEEFEVSISGLIPKWFFVILEDTSEGFVALTQSLPWGREVAVRFVYSEELMQFEDLENKKNYKLWDKLKVKLREVDMLGLRMNFAIV